MKLSANLKRAYIFGIFWSVLFFGVLHWCLFQPDRRWPIILVAAITYGFGYGVAGYMWGKGDDQSKVRYHLGYWYALSGTLTSTLVGGIWVLFFKRDDWEGLVGVLSILFIQIILFKLVGRSTIKGIPKQELFK